MNDINKVLKTAALRLGMTNFLLGLTFVLMIGIGLLILLRLTQQIVGFDLPWRNVVVGVAGASALIALVYSIVVRPKPVAVARKVDEGANLRESLSTALCVMGQQDDPWARAAVESAVQKARTVRVAQAVPIQAPKFWPVTFAMALALTVLYFMPRVDVFGLNAKKIAKEKEAANIVVARNEVKEVEKKIEKMKEDLGIEKEKGEPPSAAKPESANPDEIRKSAIKDLTKLSDRLEQLKKGEKSQTLKQIQDKLKQIQSPGKETSELAKALSSGQFSQAAKELEKMKDEISSGEMSPSEKQNLSAQLEEMAKQAEELAKNKEEIKQAMQQAGLDPALADATPQQMKQALENAQNMNSEQKQQMQQMAEAMSQSQQAMSRLSESMSQMSQAASEQNQQSAQQKSEQASQSGQSQLSDMEQMQQEMQQASAAQQELQEQIQQLASQCNGQGEGQGEGNGQKNGQGQPQESSQWSDAWSDKEGNGGGGGGRGTGENFAGNRTSASADFSTKKERAIGPMGKGRVIGSRLVEGDSIKGESTAEFSATVATASQSATESMENNVIPREFHDAVKNYFGGLKQKAPAAKDSKDAAPAKPADDSKAKPTDGDKK
jgi:chemotaxis protein histidine kinase CheA